jgi:hypothetical protein
MDQSRQFRRAGFLLCAFVLAIGCDFAWSWGQLRDAGVLGFVAALGLYWSVKLP